MTEADDTYAVERLQPILAAYEEVVTSLVDDLCKLKEEHPAEDCVLVASFVAENLQREEMTRHKAIGLLYTAVLRLAKQAQGEEEGWQRLLDMFAQADCPLGEKEEE